jgi:hypothetical protein
MRQRTPAEISSPGATITDASMTFTVDDPDAFYEPWSGTRRYRRTEQQFAEDICAENNQLVFDYKILVANKPDF